jgi:hypothetical protein
MRAIDLTLVAAVGLAGCMTVPPIAATPSGRPEAVFDSTTGPDVAGRIATRCLDGGLVIQNQTNTQIVCSKELQGGDAIIATMAIGNSYSTTPVRNIRFNIVQIGPNVRVQAYQWVQTQMAFGQVNQMELNGGAQFNDIQQMLLNMGGRLP